MDNITDVLNRSGTQLESAEMLGRARSYGEVLIRDGGLSEAAQRILNAVTDSVNVTEAEPIVEPGPRIV